jgi:hypothetical protein
MILTLYFVVVWLLERKSHGKMSTSVYFVCRELGDLAAVDL